MKLIFWISQQNPCVFFITIQKIGELTFELNSIQVAETIQNDGHQPSVRQEAKELPPENKG